MSKSYIIVISGRPGVGKTTLGRKISEILKIPFIGRDDLKESLFDSLGFSDREWSRKIGGATFRILYYILEQNLKTQNTIIVETAFDPHQDARQLSELFKKYSMAPIEINCFTDYETRKKRFIERNESGERHPGHIDHTNYNKSNPSTHGDPACLKISDKLISVDTTDFSKLDYLVISNQIKDLLNDA